jgi:hypothetical protein
MQLLKTMNLPSEVYRCNIISGPKHKLFSDRKNAVNDCETNNSFVLHCNSILCIKSSKAKV